MKDLLRQVLFLIWLFIPGLVSAQMNTIQLRNGAFSTTILPSTTTTINLQLPSLSTGTHYLLTSSTDPGSSGIGSSLLNYGPSSTQNTLAISASNYLFDVSYSSTIVNAAALGARISSTATDGNNNATGLTLSATATGTGTARAVSVSAASGTGTTDAVYIGAGRLTFLESVGATFVTSFQAGDQSANINYTLPATAGTNGQALQTNGSAVLSWATTPAVGSLDALSDVKVYGGTTSIAMGVQPASASGSFNTSYGITALQSATSGNSNTALGYDALRLVNTGSENTAVGYEALRAITTSGNNTAVGSGSQRSATGNENTTAGYQTGYNLSGTGNTAVGYRSLYATTSGNYNIAIGYDALYGGTTASHNIGIGYYALQGTAGTPNTGSYNIAIGGSNAPNMTSGANNLLIGYNSGLALTMGSQNVVIGYGAGDDLTTGTGNVIIGYQVGSANNIDTENNLLLIDNSSTATPLIEGDFTDGSEYLKINGDLQVSGGGIQLGAAGAAVTVDGANTATIDATAYSAVQINSNNDGTNDAITITGGTNGMLIHVYYNKTTGAENIVIGGTTHVITAGKSAGITVCRVNGTWRVVALVIYP
jgi:hypothetical protein